MKNSADLGGCYPPWPWASVDTRNTLLDLQNSSCPMKAKLIQNIIKLLKEEMSSLFFCSQ